MGRDLDLDDLVFANPSARNELCELRQRAEKLEAKLAKQNEEMLALIGERNEAREERDALARVVKMLEEIDNGNM